MSGTNSVHMSYSTYQPAPSAPPMEPQGQPHISISVQASVHPQPAYPQAAAQVPGMAVRQWMHTDTTALLAEAGKVARSILSPQVAQVAQASAYRAASMPSAAPVLNVDLSRREVNILSNRTENHYHAPANAQNRRQQQEDDKSKRTLVFIGGLILAGIAAYFTGKNVAKNENAQEARDTFAALKGKWIQHRPAYQAQNPAYSNLVDAVVQKTESILASKQTNRIHNIALAILFLTAGVVCMAGALAGSNALMVSGLVVGVAATLFGLYKLGYNCFSKRSQGEALDVQGLLRQINQQPINVYA